MNPTIDRNPSAESAIEATAQEASVQKDAALSHSASRRRRVERRHDRLKWIVPVHTLGGVVLGIFLFHPVTMVIYCFEFHPELMQSGVLHLVTSRVENAFVPQMWPMTGAFALIGALLGMGFGPILFGTVVAAAR